MPARNPQLGLQSGPALDTSGFENASSPNLAGNEVLGTQIRTKNPEEMQSVINQKLFQDYAKQNKIEASQKDIDLYIAKMDQFMRDDRKKKDARRVEIQQQLKAEALPSEQTKQLRSELDVLEDLHKYDLQEDKALKHPSGSILLPTASTLSTSRGAKRSDRLLTNPFGCRSKLYFF